MFPTEVKNNIILVTLGWMEDVAKRVGNGVAWPLTSPHRRFIDIVEHIEDMPFEEWKKEVTMFMEGHAMARNDEYDFAKARVRLDADGHFQGNEAPWEEVSRQEADVRVLLQKYWLHRPQHDPMTCKLCSGHLPQFCKERKG